MQVFKDGQVAHYKQIFPNTSFPASGPSDDFLASQGAVKVSMFREHNRATQKLVPCDPVVENGFAYLVAVADKTAEELASDVATKAAQMRATRNKLLADTDWRFRSDMNPSQEWIDYCQALRDLPSNPNFPNVELPSAPGVVAGNSD